MLSLIEVIRRQYKPKDFVVKVDRSGEPLYVPAATGAQTAPGLIVFRYDAELYNANASRFVDDVEALISSAPDPVRWVVLDAGALADVDYSAGLRLAALLDYFDARDITFVLVHADPGLLETLRMYGLGDRIPEARQYGTLAEAIAAFKAAAQPLPGKSP